MVKAQATPQSAVHHYVRTFFAAFFGIIALVLILASILVVWANRTLTDTPTYVQAVTPLVSQPAVQNFVAEKVADQLEQSTPIKDLANTLLSPAQVGDKSDDELTALITPEIQTSVVQILSSPSFAQLWKATNQTEHAQLIEQLDANAPQITLDLGPLVNGVTQQLKQTELAPISDKINLSSTTAKVNFKGSQLDKVHEFYVIVKTAPIVIIIITLLSIGLSVLISVHHAKTLRRIIIGTGVIALMVAGLIEVPAVAQLPIQDPATQQLVTTLESTLLHPLQLACLLSSGVCLVAALGSKLYDLRQAHTK